MSETLESFVTIGCEGGGPETLRVCQLKVPLYKALSRHLTSTHCDAVDSYNLVLRVDGSLAKYGEEGLARLRFSKVHRYVNVDIQVPEAVWQTKNDPELRGYIAAQVAKAISSCIGRLQKDKHLVES